MLQVADMGGGEVLLAVASSVGGVVLGRLLVPRTPGTSPEDIQVKGVCTPVHVKWNFSTGTPATGTRYHFRPRVQGTGSRVPVQHALRKTFLRIFKFIGLYLARSDGKHTGSCVCTTGGASDSRFVALLLVALGAQCPGS